MNSISDDSGAGQDQARLYEWVPVIIRFIPFVAGIALLISVAVYIFQFWGDLADSHSRWGEFGDYLGGILNPIFALLALFALLFTIVLQSRELRNSTHELATSARALKEQSALLKLQSFEQTFFEMVRLHHDIIKDLDLVPNRHGRLGNTPSTVGRDCFRVFFDRLKSDHGEANHELGSQGQLAIVQNAYSRFYPKHQHEIGHYFRNLHRILKFVDESAVANKAQYAGILRAQLSSFELALLFYNALNPVGDKLKPHVERYAMLENLDLQLLCNPADEVRLFSMAAYGEQDLSRYHGFGDSSDGTGGD